MATKKRAKKSSKRTSKRRRRSLVSKAEQKIITSMTKKGATMRQIAKKIRRAPSTIWRWQNQ